MQRTITALILLLATMIGRPAAAQVETAGIDIVGNWEDRFHEDLWERRSGLKVGDFTGIPLNDAGKLASLSWDPGWFAIPEEQCRPHTGIYGLRGPTGLKITADIDPVTTAIVAYRIFYAAGTDRVIWMDGRPHPPEYALHTFAGFSTGRWEGNMLTVKTTHVKAGYHQRNGVPHSDMATATEHFIRQGDTLMQVIIVEDPVYLSEPFIRTTNWVATQAPPVGGGGTLACGAFQIVNESGGTENKHFVPHFLPGDYDQAKEFQTEFKVPPEGAYGGAETLYPEFMPKLKKAQQEFLSQNAPASTEEIDPAKAGFFGKWKLDRARSTFQTSWLRIGMEEGRDGTAPERRTMVIEPAGGGIRHITDTQIVANDSGVFRTEYTAQFDGKDVPIKGGVLETVSLKRLDDHTFERTGKIKGDVVETSTWKLSPDGKTLTVTTKGKVPQGQGAPAEYSNTQLFERQ
jgi:hypothetical protein